MRGKTGPTSIPMLRARNVLSRAGYSAFQGRFASPRVSVFRSCSGEAASMQRASHFEEDDSEDFTWMSMSIPGLVQNDVSRVESTSHYVAAPTSEAYLAQYQLEALAVQRTLEEYANMRENLFQLKKGATLSPSKRVLVKWFEPLVEAIDREQRDICERERGVDRSSYGPYLILLPPEVLAVITIHEVVNHSLFVAGK